MAENESENETTVVDAPSEDEDEAVWLWREPQREVRLPLGFRGPAIKDAKDVDPGLIRTVELIKMDGRCDDLLQSDRGTRKDISDRMNEVLSRCIVAMTGTDGTKARKEGVKPKDLPRFFLPEILKMPMLNRIFLIVRLRQLSVHDPGQAISGHKFTYSATCSSCGKVNLSLYVRLDTLEVKEVDDTFAEEEVHTLNHDGHTIEWVLPTGADEPKIDSIVERKSDEKASEFLLHVVRKIDGKKPTLGALQDLSRSTRTAINRALNVGGINMRVTNECEHCHREFAITIPWTQRTFFFPSEDES